MKPARRVKVELVERTGGMNEALDLACEIIVWLIGGSSMGMLRAGKKGREPEPRAEPVE